MRTRLTVGKQLAIGISALIACVVVLSFTSLRVISKLGTSLDRAVNGTAEKLDLLAGTRDGYQRLKARSTQEQISYSIAELARRSPNGAQWTCQSCHIPSSADETLRDIKASADGIQQRTAELHGLVTDELGIKALETLNRGAAQWVENTQEYLRLDTSNHFDDAHAILRDQMFPLIEETDKAADLLAQKERAELAASHQQAKLEIAGGRWAVFIVILINLCVAFVLLWLVRRMTAELRLMASELSESAGQVASAAGQISSSSQSLAQGASEQAASLEETSASSEEINSMARKNAENSQHANSLVTQSQQKFDETNQSLEAMVAAMGDIKDSSDKVAKIIKVIDEIAFQTNILALNAAVEAARAGEAGMGFAVVADEVRNLAQRCAQAAKDTAALIEESIVKSNDGKNKVDQVAVAIRAITEESARVKTLFEEVTVGSEEQTRGIEQVAKALTQMEQVTQQAAANAEESAAAAEELTAQASTLMEVVHQLSAMVGGGETVNAASSSHRVSTINYGTAAGNSFCTDSNSMPMVYAAAAKK